MKNHIYQKTREFQNDRYPIAIQWTPSHLDLSENEKADLIAKMRAKGVGRLFECWSSFTYIKKNLVIGHSKESLSSIK